MTSNIFEKNYNEILKVPRVLIVSSTLMSHDSATGSLVKDLFTGWPKPALAQVYTYSGDPEFEFDVCDKYFRLSRKGYNLKNIIQKVNNFSPEIIYLRLVDTPLILMQFVNKFVDENNVCLINHIMDDWPQYPNTKNKKIIYQTNLLLNKLLKQAYLNLSISQKMSNAFEKRYGVHFEAIHNFINPSEWKHSLPKQDINTNKYFIIRYSGSLVKDMQLDSVFDIAKAVDSLQTKIPVKLEIFVHNRFKKNAKQLKKLKGVTIKSFVQRKDYKNTLYTADMLILAVNFDVSSLNYVRYSMANKLPEYMASGTPILTYGPLDSATIEYMYEGQWGEVVIEKNITAIADAIKKVYFNQEKHQKLANTARKYVFDEHNEKKTKIKFQNFFISTVNNMTQNVNKEKDYLLGDYSRGSNIQFDEANIIAEFISPKDGVMINVGAHFGSSLPEFLNKGWKIFAFEPDENNRYVLEKNYGNHPDIKISSYAVSNQANEKMAFFTSKESTGISSLTPFHNTHKETETVSVTTLAHICQQNNISHIDFLLIDTEGFDLLVLQGLDWNKIKPEAIVCEFENKKTESLGYSFYDLADFLKDKGYQLLISEWHPIIRYGIKHDWRRLAQYPCKLADENSWGNIIAFKEPPDWYKLMPILNKEAIPSPSPSQLLLSRIIRNIKKLGFNRLFNLYW